MRIGTMMNCTKCLGAKATHSAYANYNSATGEFSEGMKSCHYCNGRGEFPELDVDAIIAAIFTTRKVKQFRKSLASPNGREPGAARAYYVWRLARFHGGADVTMPVTAMMLIEGDPLAKQLDAMADKVAEKVYGTSLAAASRWGRSLGFGELPASVGNLPASAFEGGPVHDGNDPLTNMMLKHEGSE